MSFNLLGFVFSPVCEAHQLFMCKLMFGFQAPGYKESSPVDINFRTQINIFVPALQRKQRATLAIFTAGIGKTLPDGGGLMVGTLEINIIIDV